MGKISPVSAKYIIHAQILIDGVVDRPDVIGAIFGQTEGLLGADLELREAQRSGRIGRIEVKSEVRAGKTYGTITVPSSLDKAETAIIGAALETIQRIGPCNSRVKVEAVEDVRVSKRRAIVDRAKELLRELTTNVLPDSQEITDEVAQSVRMMEITEFGRDRLPAGPNIMESEELIVVEGRADVLNLLRHGIKNCIALNGTNVPETIIELGKKKIITLFVDGDRGGELIIKEVAGTTDIDYVARAPDGKEVEEITKKELHKAIRSRVTPEQIKVELEGKKIEPRPVVNHRKMDLTKPQRDVFRRLLEDLIGTRGAYILDQKSNILGKVPLSELIGTIRGLNSVYAVVFDGLITKEIVDVAEKAGVKYIAAMNSKVRPQDTGIGILTSANL